jgi:hypothetical protein
MYGLLDMRARAQRGHSFGQGSLCVAWPAQALGAPLGPDSSCFWLLLRLVVACARL